jgi:hypothetical protein
MKFTTDDFPIRAEPLTRRRQRRRIVNMADESDGEVTWNRMMMMMLIDLMNLI